MEETVRAVDAKRVQLEAILNEKEASLMTFMEKEATYTSEITLLKDQLRILQERYEEQTAHASACTQKEEGTRAVMESYRAKSDELQEKVISQESIIEQLSTQLSSLEVRCPGQRYFLWTSCFSAALSVDLQ